MSELAAFLKIVKDAPLVGKAEFVRTHVAGKQVLDLGCVDHSLEKCLRRPDRWLHNVIRTHAESVLGVDLLEKEVVELRKMGYDMFCADALSLRLDRTFDVVVCGDLIEHAPNPGGLLATIAHHLRADGLGIVTTPNPFAIARLFNILADGWTDINTEHVCWFCPQTMYQLMERSGMFIERFCWLKTDHPVWTKRRYWGRLLNHLAPLIANRRHALWNDFGVVIRKKP